MIPLKVSGPFHSRMLTEAGKKLGQVLENVSVSKPQIPYVANVTAQYVTDAESDKTTVRETGFFLRPVAAECGNDDRRWRGYFH